MKYLATGPAPDSHIFNKFFKADKSKVRTRQRVKSRRMFKLEEAGMVERKDSPLFREVIYFLTKKAAPIVAAEHGMDLANVWSTFNDNNLEHDLYVSLVAKKILKEAEEKKLYELAYLELECALKASQKVQKGSYFPDLLAGIVGPSMTNAFDLEIDCGSVSRKDFMGKVGYFENKILVVTKTWQRLNLLRWYLQADDVGKTVYLIVLKEFFSEPLLECKWYTNVSEEPTMLSLL
jgi:DNA-binding MarR family transcriptional regulator